MATVRTAGGDQLRAAGRARALPLAHELAARAAEVPRGQLGC